MLAYSSLCVASFPERVITSYGIRETQLRDFFHSDRMLVNPHSLSRPVNLAIPSAKPACLPASPSRASCLVARMLAKCVIDNINLF